ncbi:HEAT repeat-containing protein 5B [Eurytemora carolleeae]|uniref:HEAT repeat-containing protein 5B n=1 Tax=Eurytemora carolleeae TaxID=1294199 RepID=UPI000C759891|nr:HEAT repeat-containing protein 5B [Eurytemora carolleeae]|eukprot:XP_023347268.1 HEAT repeat-containing protein 5B-like [Eurytemora affinis]
MEKSQKLILDEEFSSSLPEPRRSIFIYEWLTYLSKVLPNVSKDDVKTSQNKIVEQLMNLVQQGSPGPPVRELLAVCLSTLFSVGDTYLLFETINKCNDILKSKDDSPTYLASRLAATVTAGAMYERLGRMMGRSYEETVQVHCEPENKGIGRLMLEFATFLYTTEFESLCSLCLRALDSTTYQARLTIAKLLGTLVAYTQGVGSGKGSLLGIVTQQSRKSSKSIEEALGLLTQGFLRGGVGSFLKGGGSAVSPEVRVGVAYSFVFCFRCLGQSWVEKNLSVIITQVSELVSSPKSGSTHTELVCARNSVSFILSSVLGRMLREKAQLSACKELVSSLLRSISCTTADQVQMSGIVFNCLLSPSSAISGYSCGLAALLGAVVNTPNGVPHTRGKIIFNSGEELLRSASQNSRLSKERTRAGWILIGAIMSLGSSVVKGLLPRCMLLWRNAFPRSQKDLESEQARGDAFTWLVSLEARSGALASMHSFVVSCPDLLTEDILRRLGVPLEGLSFSAQLRAPAATVRLRLLEVISVLPTSTLESSYTSLLRLLVAEITLSDSSTVPTSTSILPSLLTPGDSVLLGLDVEDELNKLIEDQLAHYSAAGSGALEHDPCFLFRSRDSENLPLPLVMAKHFYETRLEPDEFSEMELLWIDRLEPRELPEMELLRVDRLEPRELPEMEVLWADSLEPDEFPEMELLWVDRLEPREFPEMELLWADRLEPDEFPEMELLWVDRLEPREFPKLELLWADRLEPREFPEMKLLWVISDEKITADMTLKSIEYPKSAVDVASRTGHSLALGCIHKYVGGLSTSQHIQPSVSILLPLSQDSASPVVQAWALHALALLADSGGPMFRSYVEPTLTSLLKLLLTTPLTQADVLVCLGKLLQAIITTLGPELSVYDASVTEARNSIILAASILQTGEPHVQSESLSSLQQLHMFAPRHLDLYSLVPRLIKLLRSSSLPLRRSAVACLRQLSQRESREICDIAAGESNTGIKDTHQVENILAYSESGLPGILFSTLDQEEDKQVLRDCEETLLSLLGNLASENLSSWLNLTKEILTTSSDIQEERKEDREEVDEDDATFTKGEDTSAQGSVQPRWTTRVFAAVCLKKIISDCCSGDRAHFDLSLAREMRMAGGHRSDFLVLHLTELVRMVFMAATSESDPLKLEGLETLRVVVEKFAETPEPEFPGHVILEQYQAQVGAALRPAFAPDMASHVTARACSVCSTWISSGVVRDLNDLKRVYQLLVSSLSKLKKGSSSNCYNESASTLEKLSILQAWAEVYIVSMNSESAKDTSFEDFDDDDNFGDFSTSPREENSLSELVATELPSLSKHWLAAMKDHALLCLSPEFKSQLPYEGGAFYTNDTIQLARPHYKLTWAPILHAACLWLTRGGGFENVQNEKMELDVVDSGNIGLGAANATSQSDPSDINRSRFHLLLGVSLEALCSPRSGELSRNQLSSCLGALEALLEGEITRKMLATEKGILVELCNVLHRQLLSQENIGTQARIMSVVSLAVRAAAQEFADIKRAKLKEIYPANQALTEIPPEVALLGEGGEEGNIKPGSSPAFAVLEVCLCVLVRYYPDVSPRAAKSSSVIAMQARSRARSSHGAQLTDEQLQLVSSSVHTLASILSLQCYQTLLSTQLLSASSAIKLYSQPSCYQPPVLSNSTLNPVAISLQCYQTLLSTQLLSASSAIKLYYQPSCYQPPVLSNSTLNPVVITFLCYQNPDPQKYAFVLPIYLSIYISIYLTRCQLLDIYIPVLVNLLQTEEAGISSKSRHEMALMRLTRVGAQYPADFKRLLSSNEDLKRRVESAVLQNQAQERAKLLAQQQQQQVQVNKPSIQLKTDFSNFK